MANIVNQGTRRSFLAIRAVASLFDYRQSNWLDSSYFVAGANGQKEVYPGLVVAKNTVSYKWVPYNSGAAYGPGSDGTDSVLGVLDTFEDVTLGDQAVAPLYHGKVIQRHCYIFGSTLGNITAGVKNALPDIEWVE